MIRRLIQSSMDIQKIIALAAIALGSFVQTHSADVPGVIEAEAQQQDTKIYNVDDLNDPELLRRTAIDQFGVCIEQIAEKREAKGNWEFRILTKHNETIVISTHSEPNADTLRIMSKLYQSLEPCILNGRYEQSQQPQMLNGLILCLRHKFKAKDLSEIFKANTQLITELIEEMSKIAPIFEVNAELIKKAKDLISTCEVNVELVREVKKMIDKLAESGVQEPVFLSRAPNA